MYIANHKQFEKSTGNPNPKKGRAPKGSTLPTFCTTTIVKKNALKIRACARYHFR